MSKIAVNIAGKQWSGWQFASVFRSVDFIAGNFVVKFGDIFENGYQNNFHFGDPVKITVNNYRILTGYLEDIVLDYNAEDGAVILYGRDVTGVLVDCSYTGTATEWKRQSVKAVIQQLCSPFGISVFVDSSAAAAAATIIESVKATEGDTVIEIIRQICNDYSIMPITLGDGKLTLTQLISNRKTSDGITIPGNAVSAIFRGSDTDRYSEYIVKGVGIGTPEKSLPAFIQPRAVVKDAIVKNKRPRIIFAETAATSASCERRAIWERNYNAGMSRQREYTLSSWAQENDVPWDIHNLVAVKDDFLKTAGQLYIREVEFTREDDTETCVVNCVDPATYSSTGTVQKMELDK